MATIGRNEFHGNVNEFYNMIEPIIRQEIEAARNDNALLGVDGFWFYDCREGTGQTIESSIVQAAEAMGWSPTNAAPDLAPKDPTVYTKYFSEWVTKQFKTTVRTDDIRRVATNKGAGAEDIRFAIVNSLTQGEAAYDFDEKRKLILSSPVFDFAAINGGVVPSTMDGVLIVLRDAYNHLIAKNDDCTDGGFASVTPRENVRIAIPSKLMNLVDVVAMANLFNMSQAEILGQIVVVNCDDLPESMWYKCVIYDRHAFGIAEFIYEYGQDPYWASARFQNEFLTVSRQYFYNALFKAVAIDCSAAAAAVLESNTQARTTYTVTPTLNDVATLDPAPAANIGKGMALYARVVPVSGKTLAGITVTVNMTSDITSTAYDATTGVISISAVTANVTITTT